MSSPAFPSPAISGVFTGMTYGVLAQVSVHGTDNTMPLRVLRDIPGGREHPPGIR